MTSPNPVFKFSRAGKVFLENVTLTEAIKLVANKTIQQTDHYWTDGLADWNLVSSRYWVATPEETATPEHRSFVLSSSSRARPPAMPLLANDSNKGFSPYVIIYRSDDDRWAYGIFGGLAHRNGWSNSTLILVRLFTLISFFPALAYLCSWGFIWLLLTPSLPTAKVKSYYDLN